MPNRKNSLFVGNARRSRTAAILASLTSTCRRHDVDPRLYLTQLLIDLPTTRMSELSAWLPDQWKLAQAARLASLQNQAPCGLEHVVHVTLTITECVADLESVRLKGVDGDGLRGLIRQDMLAASEAQRSRLRLETAKGCHELFDLASR